MTARLLFPSVKQNGQGGQYIIEDPDLSKKRLFIESYAYDIDTLRPRNNETFKHNDLTNREPTSAAITGGRYQFPYILTNGKYFYAVTTSRADTESATGHCEPWFASLDYDRLPGRHTFMCKSGLIHMAIYYSYSTTTGLQTVWNGYDLNSNGNYGNYNQSVNFIGFYEDPYAPNQWFGINHDSPGTNVGPRLGKLVLSGSGPTFVSASGDRSGLYQNPLFFLGVNTDSSVMFLELDGIHQGIKVHRLNTGNQAFQVFDWVHNEAPQTHHQIPSKLIHTSETRKVFYQGGWSSHDGNAQLSEEFKDVFFNRFIWNPITQKIDVKRCTINYPAGKYHYNYQRYVRWESTWQNRYYANWFYRPHVFNVGSQTYLTFMLIDKSTPNYYSERAGYYRRELTNTWVTFVVGSGENDDQLTYHSTIAFDQPRHFVRYALPTNTAGNQLVIFRLDTTETLTFDTVLGWVSHDLERISMRTCGQDSTGRIYILTGGVNNYYDNTTGTYDQSLGTGYNRIYEYIPNSPIVVNATALQDTYVYSGTPINSSLSITARNSLKNVLVAQTVKLVATGTNVQFTNGTNSTTVTTSSSGAVTVPFTILGAGQPLISAHVIL